MIDYLNPQCRIQTIDSFTNVKLILEAVSRSTPKLNGTVLDVGCGDMPYKQYVMSNNPKVERWIGVDLPETNFHADTMWDGTRIPFDSESIDSAIMTEVLEHCPEPQAVLNEVYRVLKPGGVLFLTVPFIWPIHTVPHDEYRYTPFSLARMIRASGFQKIEIQATGGRHAMLAAVLGLWCRRRPLTSRRHLVSRYLLSDVVY